MTGVQTCALPISLPRELEYRDGKIWQKPVREIENYRKNRCCYENVKVGESLSLEGVRGRMIDLIVELQNADGIVDGSRNSGNQNQEALDVYNEFRIELARNEEYTTVFTYDRKRQILEIDRTSLKTTGIFQMFFHMLPLVQDQLKTSSTDLYVQELMFQPE